MKNINKLYLAFSFLLVFIYMELLLRTAANDYVISIFSGGLLLHMLFALPFCFILVIFSSLFKDTVNFIITSVLLGIISLIYASQLVYHDVFKTFYNFYSMGNAGQILGFWNGIVSAVKDDVLWILLMFLPMLAFVFFGRRLFSFRQVRINLVVTLVVLAFISQAAGLFTLSTQGKGRNTAYDLYYHSSAPVLSVERMGLLTTMRLDLQRTLLGWSPTLAAPPAQPVDLVVDTGEEDKEKDVENPEETQENAEPGDSAEPEETQTQPEEPIEVQPEYNVMDIDFDTLIANEKDETVKGMHQYFKNVVPTQKNDHTGIFKNYNLIFLTAEGFSSLAVDKDLTPTLYKLVHEGYDFTDFYVPLWDVSTSDGEYVATNGLIPKSGVWSFSKSGHNYVPFVMGNQLKKLGYKTVAYHDHTYTYYDRNISHPNMGYEYKGVGNGLDVKKTWPESDIEMMEKTIPEYMSSQPFHAYYMTVSGHLEYNFMGNRMAIKNKEYVKDLDLSDPAKAYLATQIELDRAMEYLMNELDKAGVLDHTLIVLSADHYPYGLKDEALNELAGKELEKNFEIYKSNLIIYAKGMETTVIDEPVSSLDILPTISNLLGVEYDSRLLMGRDVFSDAPPFVIFRNGSFITDKGRYNAVTGKFEANEGVEVSQEYIDAVNAKVDEKFYYSAQILSKDYYGKVFK